MNQIDQLLNQFRGSVPALVGALAILLVGYIVALLASSIVRRALGRTGIDERIARTIAGPGRPASTNSGRWAGKAVFWLIMIFVLVAFFQALGLTQITQPLNGFLNQVLAFIPQLIAAGALALVAYIIARVLRSLVQNGLRATRLDERLGTATSDGGGPMSSAIASIAYFLVFLFFLPAILGALQLQGLLEPVQTMIDRILAFLPNLAAAALTLAIAYFAGRVLAQIVTGLLSGAGLDTLPARLGFGGRTATQPPLSTIAGQILLVGIMLFASIEALNALGFESLSAIMTTLLTLVGRVVLGLIIFGLGFFLARLAASAVRSSGLANAGTLAMVAQSGILVLAGAMALQQMGFAEEIVNLAFGLLLGAIAVAAALAFGLGGREVARQELERALNSTRRRPNQQS